MKTQFTQAVLLQKPELEAENERLRLELEAVRADRDRLLSSQQASTSGQTSFGWQAPLLPPPKQQQQAGLRACKHGHGKCEKCTHSTSQLL